MKLQELLCEESQADLDTKDLIKQVSAISKKYQETMSGPKPPLFGKFACNGQGKIFFKSNELRIRNYWLDENGELILPFISCNQLIISGVKLSSFKNFPETVHGYANMAITAMMVKEHGEVKIKSWDGFPMYMKGDVFLGHEKFSELDYSRWDKRIGYLRGDLTVGQNYVGPLLSMLNVSGLKSLRGGPIVGINVPTAVKIVNKHLHTADKDILDCQEELISNGFKEFAKL